MHQRLTYGSDAKTYIRLKLSTQSSFWRLLAQLPIERGQVFGYLPPSAAREDLSFFEWHIHSREDLESQGIDREYVSKERDFLAQWLQKEGGLGIFYGTTVPPNGKIRAVNLRDIATFSHRFSLGRNDNLEAALPTETYYVVRGGLSRERLDYFIDNVVERLPLMGALTSLSGRQLPENGELDDRLLAELARRAEVIVMSAYGGDANLIWTRI